MHPILYVNIFELVLNAQQDQLLCANLCDGDITNQSNPSPCAKPVETISLEAQTVYKGKIQIFFKHMSQS